MCMCARDNDMSTYIGEVAGSVQVGGPGRADGTASCQAEPPAKPHLSPHRRPCTQIGRADAHTEAAIALSSGGTGEGCGDGAATVRLQGQGAQGSCSPRWRRGAQGPMRSRHAGAAHMIAVGMKPSEGAL